MFAPSFEGCIFLDHDTVLGATSRERPLLYHCKWGSACEPTDPGFRLAVFTAFFRQTDGAVGVIGASEGGTFRRAWLAGARFQEVASDVEGDVLDYDGTATRIGRDGRYRSSLSPSSTAVVFKQRRIGGKYFAIVANDEATRTLAELHGDAWSLHLAPSLVPARRAATPREVWLALADGGSSQAWLFGAENVEKAVLWLHGGPHESVSPRYDAYFDWLNERCGRCGGVRFRIFRRARHHAHGGLHGHDDRRAAISRFPAT
jgi:dipeptidyl aminopeptidase/acylaminoacyl peptidase